MANIWGAAETGDLAEVQRLVVQEPGLLNAALPLVQLLHAVTPLMLASRGGHGEVVRWLLDRGVPVNHKSAGNRTALCFASDAGHVQVVRLLLEKGGNPTLADAWGATPLFRACVGGHLETVKCLLNHPSAAAVVNHRDTMGRTALLMASEAGHVDVVNTLLQKGADPQIASIYGLTPMGLARNRNHITCIKALEVRCPLCLLAPKHSPPD
jgi:uncharacterized protein